MFERKKLLKFSICSAIFVIVLGFLLHFTFNWSNNNSLVGLFSAVNESIWEHLKILFFPMLITTIIGCFYFKKDIPNYLTIKTKAILLALIFIVVFHYTYSGILGNHIAIIDIASFIFAAILGEVYTYKRIKNDITRNNKVAFITLIIISISFIIFTFYPPHIGIFKDTSTNTYGIKN